MFFSREDDEIVQLDSIYKVSTNQDSAFFDSNFNSDLVGVQYQPPTPIPK